MGKFFTLLSLPLVFSLSACSGEVEEPERVLSFRNAEIYQGKVFAGNENEAFTGVITDFPISSVNVSPLVGLAASANQVTGDSSTHKYMLQGSILTMVHGAGGYAICQAKFMEGYLHGSMSCNTASNNLPILEATYQQGQLDGPFIIYSLKNENHNKLAEGNLVNGKIDGEFIGYGLITSKPVLIQNLKLGQAMGSFKRYSDDANNHLILEKSYDQGVIDGSVVAYSIETGKLILERTYEQGTLHGNEKQYDAETGELTLERSYIYGTAGGAEREYDPNTGELIRSVYIDDVGTIENPDDINIEECVESWIDFHNQGKEEPLLWRYDVLHELRGRCAAGESPEA
ncbi:toxin-antitoxin system YwqK family antitoxin [Nitrincola tibetensis]|uniref:toxin-antitoxin system YwqK family antitoxin n=1 Tax=Nitrincola tibetensis TaxID=2219697 RepID=UPI0010581028|nr:hypothetical protein [Nitrincola tibetensis]